MKDNRNSILWGAAASVGGVILALVLDPTLGGLLVIGGVGLTLLGLHRLGRSGADSAR